MGFPVPRCEGRVDTAIGNQKSYEAAGFWTLRVQAQRHPCQSVGGTGGGQSSGQSGKAWVLLAVLVLRCGQRQEGLPGRSPGKSVCP